MRAWVGAERDHVLPVVQARVFGRGHGFAESAARFVVWLVAGEQEEACGCRKLGSEPQSGGSSLVALESLVHEFERNLIFAVSRVQAAA